MSLRRLCLLEMRSQAQPGNELKNWDAPQIYGINSKSHNLIIPKWYKPQIHVWNQSKIQNLKSKIE
jgi:hypothetical protein